eukprot:3927810-Rhodomonas_salina.1
MSAATGWFSSGRVAWASKPIRDSCECGPSPRYHPCSVGGSIPGLYCSSLSHSPSAGADYQLQLDWTIADICAHHRDGLAVVRRDVHGRRLDLTHHRQVAHHVTRF